MVRILLALLVLESFGSASASAAPPDDLFELQRLEPRDGRTVAAELADFDGDGRSDLLQVVFAGVPPHETRHQLS